MDKVAKQLYLDFMACCTLPFYDLESKRIPRILLYCCIGQIHRHTQPHLLLLLPPQQQQQQQENPTKHACLFFFFSLPSIPTRQSAHRLVLVVCASGVILRSILRNGNPSASTPARLVKSIGSGKRVKRPRPFVLFTRTETSDY